jgi:hypothetical protein
MEKVIQLGKKELKLHSSLFTIIEYRNVFGTELFSDIKKIDKLAQATDDDLSVVINTIFRVIYILNRPYVKQTYEEFLMGLDFEVLSNTDELQTLSQAIIDMLGTINKNTPSFSGSK